MKLLDAINPLYWIGKGIDKRIQKYSRGVGNEMKYNPLLVTLDNKENDKLMTRRLLENGIWYSGIEQDILYFYETEAPNFYRSNKASESLNYFWATHKDNFRKIHTGYPQLISEKMVDLITSNGYDIVVEGKKQEDLQEKLEAMLKENKFVSMLLGKSIETESWSGGVSWKLSYNPLISEYPIIEVWQPENYDCVVVSGRIVEDIFYIYYEKDNTKYRLSEMYGVNEEGAYIDYKLYSLQHFKGQQNGSWVECNLTDLDVTANLKKITFKGYNKKLSLYKANKLPNSEFRNSVLGESDYSGSYGGFDALDEIASTWIQEFRDGKLNRYFPEEFMATTTNGKTHFPDGFKKDHVVYADSPSDNADKQKIMYNQGEIRVEKHTESFKYWLQIILNNAGLSPLTVGITGLESIDASAESQQEREKVSIRTRNKKIELWNEFLPDILHRALDLYLMVETMRDNENETYTVSNLPEYEIKTVFNDYIIKSKKDRTTEVQTGAGTTYDISQGVKYVHNELTERDQLALSGRIKIENDNIDSLTKAEYSAMIDQDAEIEEYLQSIGVKLEEIPDDLKKPSIDDFNPFTDGEENNVEEEDEE